MSIHVYGGLLALGCALLSLGSFFLDPTAVFYEVILLLALLLSMGVVYVFAIRLVLLKKSSSLNAILAWGILFRLLLIPSRPILETDWNRYLWDGFVLSHGLNPYQYPPAAFQSLLQDENPESSPPIALQNFRSLLQPNERAQVLLAAINHPELNTIYPPLTQILFGGTAVLFPLSFYAWRGVILLFDAVLAACLVMLLLSVQQDPARVVLYAWSPLILKEYINTLHFDLIALAFLFAGVLLYASRHRIRSALAWAAALLIKVFPLVLLPFWFNRGEKKYLAATAGATLLVALPFCGVTREGFHGLAVFGCLWESNSSLVAGLEKLYEWFGIPAWNEGRTLFTFTGVEYAWNAFLAAKATAALIALIGIGALFYRMTRHSAPALEQRLKSTFIATGILLLCSPVANPWYIAWIVPFLCFFPQKSWIYLSQSCLLYYSFFLLTPWGYPPGIRELEYLPFFIMWMMEIWKECQSSPLQLDILPD